MREELKFHQRWEFRRGDSDFDSSTDNSKSSLGGGSASNKRKLVSSLVLVDNGETCEASKFQQNGNNDSCISGQFELGKAEKGKRRRSKNDNLAHNEKKRGSRNRKEVSPNKGKTTTNECSALDDLKNYMNSLLGELKVTRKDLLLWMRKELEKLVAEEKASESERNEGSFHLQHQNNSEDNERVQYQSLLGKNIQVQQPNSFEDYVQGNEQSKFEENVTNMENTDVQQPQKNFKENNPLARQKRIRSRPGSQNSNGGCFKKSGNNKKSLDSNNHIPALGDKVDYSQAIVLVTPTEKNGEDRLALSDKSKPKARPSDQNLQAQQQKSVVLAIRAQNCSTGSPVKNAKGKKAASSNSTCQAADKQIDYSQAIESIPLAERDKGERSGLYVEPKFSSDSFNQVASSMYLTLPSVLAKPHIANHRPDTSSFSYMQPRIAQNQAGISSERSNLILGSTSHLGYFQGMQPEERSRYSHYAQMNPRDINFFNQNNSTTSIVGSGFSVPLQAVSGGFIIPNQFDLENLPRENNNTLGLTMNEGAIRFSGGGYSLPDPYIANFHSHSNYRTDGRLMTYQDSCRFPK